MIQNLTKCNRTFCFYTWYDRVKMEENNFIFKITEDSMKFYEIHLSGSGTLFKNVISFLSSFQFSIQATIKCLIFKNKVARNFPLFLYFFFSFLNTSLSRFFNDFWYICTYIYVDVQPLWLHAIQRDMHVSRKYAFLLQKYQIFFMSSSLLLLCPVSKRLGQCYSKEVTIIP